MTGHCCAVSRRADEAIVVVPCSFFPARTAGLKERGVILAVLFMAALCVPKGPGATEACVCAIFCSVDVGVRDKNGHILLILDQAYSI